MQFFDFVLSSFFWDGIGPSDLIPVRRHAFFSTSHFQKFSISFNVPDTIEFVFIKGLVKSWSIDSRRKTGVIYCSKL